MTLALNGLSKNSFLSLVEKREIIEWYRNFFQLKADLIRQALEAERMEALYLSSLAKLRNEEINWKKLADLTENE